MTVLDLADIAGAAALKATGDDGVFTDVDRGFFDALRLDIRVMDMVLAHQYACAPVLAAKYQALKSEGVNHGFITARLAHYDRMTSALREALSRD